MMPTLASSSLTPVSTQLSLATQSTLMFTASIWEIFSALLDGPATAQSLSDRVRLSLARIHKDLASLNQAGFVEEDGGVRYGAFFERRYRLPEQSKAMNGDLQSIRQVLEIVEKGLHGAQQLDQHFIAGLTGVRVSEETARWAVAESLRFRESIYAMESLDGPIKLYVFNSAWSEEVCTR